MNTRPQTYDDGYTNIIRRNAASFLILGQPDGDKAYISTGSYNSTDLILRLPPATAGRNRIKMAPVFVH